MNTSHFTKSKGKVVIISGPTGVGKTSFAIELALKTNAEIINADSMQIYKYMDIGTAKPTHEELNAVPHSLIDIVTPDQQFDAAMFAQMAADEETRLRDKGRKAFLVGGTGLYLRAFLYGLFRTEPAEGKILDNLKAEAESQGSFAMHEKLKKVDEAAAAKIHPNDTFRIIRALEHFEKTGMPISESRKDHGFREERYDALKICLGMNRAELYDRINRRVDIMMDQGLKEEVERLLGMGYSRELKSMRSIGYRHMCEYLAGEVDLERCIEILKQDTRHYAKRQLTWFRHEQDVVWLEPWETDKAHEIISRFMDA